MTFQAINPATGETLPGDFRESSPQDVAAACERAAEAFQSYRKLSGQDKAAFLDRIADEIVALGDALLERAHQETALPLPRLAGERG